MQGDDENYNVFERSSVGSGIRLSHELGLGSDLELKAEHSRGQSAYQDSLLLLSVLLLSFTHCNCFIENW